MFQGKNIQCNCCLISRGQNKEEVYYLLEENDLLALNLVLGEDRVIAGDSKWMVINSGSRSKEGLGSLRSLVLEKKQKI